MSTSQEDLDYFRAIPQCAKLLDQPGVHIGGKNPATLTRNPLIDETLRLNEGIIRTMYYSQAEDGSTAADGPPMGVQFLQLGKGVIGQPGMIHGAFQSALIDNLTGTMIAMTGIDQGRGMLTLGLNISFKKLLFGPTVVIAKAWLDRMEGRKMFIRASVEDLEGDVCTTAEALWIIRREQKL
ncbi:hypothetical protein FE257_011885 [Aspergillus nanangensis]|uniref:Thioesterase domain-containing protein n=1 Tax=Aspergillus nanangensis TaxID=2582783 RepID=A0AAD4GR88_ASPNN|nr:hypothetical protein FE257_011885 [Aspergillus nanangensis]